MIIDVDEKLRHVRFNVDREPHITIDKTKCETCPHRACTYCCPAELYEYGENGMEFSYEGCFECGTCYVVCDQCGLTWKYPKGNHGVAFRCG